MRQLFIDLDGVLADFDGHYERVFGMRPTRGVLDPPGFWENIAAQQTFYRDLPMMEDALELWYGAQLLHPRPIILTGLPRKSTYQNAEVHKRLWVKHHLGPRARVICTQSKNKRDYGRPGDILVDDWERYRHLWEAMGGIFVLHTSAKKSLEQVERLLTVIV